MRQNQLKQEKVELVGKKDLLDTYFEKNQDKNSTESTRKDL